MNHTDAAILRTLLYADVFQFPMTPAEIHRYLIASQPITLRDIHTALGESTTLRPLLHHADGYVALAEHADYIAVRLQREGITRRLWEEALHYGRWLSWIPFVRMVALTGALAVRNPAGDDDDLDYLLVTQPGRVWLARLFAVMLVRLVRLRGRELCPNYVLASDQLCQEQRDLYIAHEVAQMLPLYGQPIYEKMMQVNGWSSAYLPNALPFQVEASPPQRIKRWIERLLSGRVGTWLEHWEQRRKSRKFLPQVEKRQSAAQVDESHVKGHFQDNGVPILEQYAARLRAYGLDEVPFSQAGD